MLVSFILLLSFFGLAGLLVLLKVGPPPFEIPPIWSWGLVQLGLVQMGVVQLGVVQSGVVQMGVVQLTPQFNWG